MKASELRPGTWLSHEVEVTSVMPHGGEEHCHVRLYASSKNLSPTDLCRQFGAQRAEVDDNLHTRTGGGGATMRFAWLHYGPDDTVPVD